MSNILTVGYATEGTTDRRFLESIIFKIFCEVAYECKGLIEVYDPYYLKFPKSGSFIDSVVGLSKSAYNIGINVLCIHVDSDSNNDDSVMRNKITPSINALKKVNSNLNCKNLVPIVPVYMTEAWMLADRNLFKQEIQTNKSNAELGIDRPPELIADPKRIIKNAVNEAQRHLPRRRVRISISDLYQPIGQKVELSKLDKLKSFQKFRESVYNAVRMLNYL